MVDRIEVWDYTAFARYLYEKGVNVVKSGSAAEMIAANFTGLTVVEVPMAAYHVCVVIGDKRVDIKL
jgi:hypothetical protein